MFPNMLVFKIWHSIPGLFFLCCTVKWRSLFHFPFPSPLPAGMYRRTLKRERGERCHVDSCEDFAFVLSLLVDYRVKTDVSSLYNTLYGLSKHKENSISAECTTFHPRLKSSLSWGSFVAVDTLISILYPKSHNMTIQNLLGFCFHYNFQDSLKLLNQWVKNEQRKCLSACMSFLHEETYAWNKYPFISEK